MSQNVVTLKSGPESLKVSNWSASVSIRHLWFPINALF